MKTDHSARWFIDKSNFQEAFIGNTPPVLASEVLS